MPRGEERQLRVEQALAWLRRELLEMQIQDQQLLEKLLQLHAALRELRVECAAWESADPSTGFGARARSSSEDMGALLGPRRSLRLGASRRNSLP